MEQYWIGITDAGKRETFKAKDQYATEDHTGYAEIEGPWKTKEEAEECL